MALKRFRVMGGDVNAYGALQEMIKTEFGSNFYTDDVAVVDADSEDQATIAILSSPSRDKVRIKYMDGRKSKIVTCIGTYPKYVFVNI